MVAIPKELSILAVLLERFEGSTVQTVLHLELGNSLVVVGSTLRCDVRDVRHFTKVHFNVLLTRVLAVPSAPRTDPLVVEIILEIQASVPTRSRPTAARGKSGGGRDR